MSVIIQSILVNFISCDACSYFVFRQG